MAGTPVFPDMITAASELAEVQLNTAAPGHVKDPPDVECVHALWCI